MWYSPGMFETAENLVRSARALCVRRESHAFGSADVTAEVTIRKASVQPEPPAKKRR